MSITPRKSVSGVTGTTSRRRASRFSFQVSNQGRQGLEFEEQEIKEKCLKSNFKLQYFNVCLFCAILEDTLIKLRILDECNTELTLMKTFSDMVHLMAKKYHVQEPLVKDELDGIDHKRLGCVEYSLNKLKADRTFVTKILKDTYLNLTTRGQFQCLTDAVVEAQSRHERFAFLTEDEAKNKLFVFYCYWQLYMIVVGCSLSTSKLCELYRDLSRQLRQLRSHIKFVTYEKNNDIEVLKSSVQDAELKSATRRRYVTGWQRARTEQHKQVIANKEALPSGNIEMYKNRIDQEQHVHSEVELLFNIKIQEVIEEIEQWMKKYETDMEQIELKIQRKKNKLDLTYERRIKLEETIEKHSQLIKNWVTFKEERKAARQYQEKMFNSAIIIQAWWRGLLVRNHLGPYKVVKKRGPPKPEEK